MITGSKRDNPHCDDNNDDDNDNSIEEDDYVGNDNLEAYLIPLDAQYEETNDVAYNEVTAELPLPRQYNAYVRQYVSLYKAIQNTETHDRLKNDLIDHLWNHYGEKAE